MNQQLTQRPEPLAFRVLISTSRGLNIILSNKRIENERTYSHFVTLEQAEQFAADLEAALSSEYYTCLDRCFLCGQPFTRTEDVCVLTNDREAHLDLFDFAPDTHSPAEYGKYMIQKSGHFEYDPNLEEFYDYEKYGVQHMSREYGAFTDRGYISYQGTLSLDELMMEEPAEQYRQEMGGMV